MIRHTETAKTEIKGSARVDYRSIVASWHIAANTRLSLPRSGVHHGES
jgi:hypothetical protein